LKISPPLYFFLQFFHIPYTTCTISPLQNAHSKLTLSTSILNLWTKIGQPVINFTSYYWDNTFLKISTVFTLRSNFLIFPTLLVLNALYTAHIQTLPYRLLFSIYGWKLGNRRKISRLIILLTHFWKYLQPLPFTQIFSYCPSYLY
jgi:hypothetical protein